MRSTGRVETAPVTPSQTSIPRIQRPEVRAPAYSGMPLDRAATLRSDPSWVARQLEQPTAHVVAASAEGVMIEAGHEPRLSRRSLASLAASGPGLIEPILLGLEHGAPLFAIDLDSLDRSAHASFVDGARIIGLRDAGALLSRSEGGLAAYLMALLNWHRRHRFCANCGAATAIAQAGYSRRCPSCGAAHFPRTDPVVIMLVEHAGRVLLGRNPRWPPRQYSALAGFVSPGESLEEAIVREVREESGIDAYEPAYVGSQPWPFPSSLMLAFHARSDGGEPLARDGELEDVRWFTRDAIEAALTGSSAELRLPPSIAVARFMIERWMARGG